VNILVVVVGGVVVVVVDGVVVTVLSVVVGTAAMKHKKDKDTYLRPLNTLAPLM